MNIVKKNIASLICGVFAILAIVGFFYPLGSIRTTAQAALDKRIAVYSAMNKVRTQERHLPMVDVAGGEPRKLEVFPTQPVIDWGQGFKQRIAEESKGVQTSAVAMNRHEVLLPKIFPVPKPAADFDFPAAYFAAMAKLPAAFHAGSPPSGQEIQDALGDLVKNRTQSGGSAPYASGTPTSEDDRKEQDQVLRSLAVSRAKSILFYMEPNALDISTQIPQQGTPPSVQAMWYAQVGFWVQSDLLGAIYDMNQSFGSVVNAPVKDVVKIQVEGYRTSNGLVSLGSGGVGGGAAAGPAGMPPGMPPGMMMGMMMGGRAPKPAAAAGGTGGASYSISPTGQVCNASYDVVQCKLIVHVEAGQLPAFLEQLGRNRLITAYHVNLDALDTITYQPTANVIYGSEPVVKATISCEVLLMRGWSVPLMPQAVREQLGVGSASTGE
jgi:hypothetical protein